MFQIVQFLMFNFFHCFENFSMPVPCVFQVFQDSSLIISLLHSYQLDRDAKQGWQSLDEHYKKIMKSANDTNIAKYTIVGYGLNDMDKAKLVHFQNDLMHREF